MAGDGVVEEVAQELGQQVKEKCGGGQRRAESLEDEECCIGAGEQEFAGSRIEIEDDIDRVEIAGVEIVAGEDAGGESALQRSETKHGIAIAAED